MPRFAKLLTILTSLVTLVLGLCGTSVGLAFILARYAYPADSLSPNTLTRHYLGIFLFAAGCLLLFFTLYRVWIRPRRRPIDPEN